MQFMKYEMENTTSEELYKKDNQISGLIPRE